MESVARQIRLIQIAMLISIVLYAVVGEVVGRRLPWNPTFFYVLSFISISVVGVIFVARRTLVLQSETLLRDRPQDLVSLGRWRAGYIVTYALCETLALFGLILRLSGLPMSQVWPFYLGGFGLLLFFGPRMPDAESKA
jgi:hypothetical protein